MKAAGPEPEIPAILYELEQRVGAVTSEALILVSDELAQRWRTLSGFERHKDTGARVRQAWLDTFPARTDPSWTPQELTRIQNTLEVMELEAATFARLVQLVNEVAAERTRGGDASQAMLDAAWKRLDAEKISPESPNRSSDI